MQTVTWVWSPGGIPLVPSRAVVLGKSVDSRGAPRQRPTAVPRTRALAKSPPWRLPVPATCETGVHSRPRGSAVLS
jgi:hypothetical protein